MQNTADMQCCRQHNAAYYGVLFRTNDHILTEVPPLIKDVFLVLFEQMKYFRIFTLFTYETF